MRTKPQNMVLHVSSKNTTVFQSRNEALTELRKQLQIKKVIALESERSQRQTSCSFTADK